MRSNLGFILVTICFVNSLLIGANVLPANKKVNVNIFNGDYLATATSWDGRLLFVTSFTGVGSTGIEETQWDWSVRVIKPEVLRPGANGVSSITTSMASPSKVFLYGEAGPDLRFSKFGNLNGISVIPDPNFLINPYPSDSLGNLTSNTKYETYKIIIITQCYHQRLGSNVPSEFCRKNTLGMLKATVIVAGAKSVGAIIQSAQVTAPGTLTKFSWSNGSQDVEMTGIEPSMTADGHLLVFQGNTDNQRYPFFGNGLGQILYSYNPLKINDPNYFKSWSKPLPLSAMYNSTLNVEIEGIPFSQKYRIASQPMRFANGQLLDPNWFEGGYPWIDLDGSEVIFQASRGGVINVDLAVRAGTSVIGDLTGHVLRHIDGPLNPDRYAITSTPEKRSTWKTRFFVSSPGLSTSMWGFSPTIQPSRMPNAFGPTYPIFASYFTGYYELSFFDYADGGYLFSLPMNEALVPGPSTHPTDLQQGIAQHPIHFSASPRLTTDLSRNRNSGALFGGAQFPYEAFNTDDVRGKFGQSIFFKGDGKVVISNTELGTNRLQGGPIFNGAIKTFTFEFFLNVLDTTIDRAMILNSEPIKLSLFKELAGVKLNLKVQSDSGLVEINSPKLAYAMTNLNKWTHFGVVFNATNNLVTFYMNGKSIGVMSIPANKEFHNLGNAMVLGPQIGRTNFVYTLDEVKLSLIERDATYFQRASYSNPTASSSGGILQLPLGLNKQELKPFARTTPAKIELGRKLFNSTLLSSNNQVACVSCHIPSLGFSDGKRTSVGVSGVPVLRNSPNIANRAFSKHQFLDGRAVDLEEQVLMPITNKDEMGFTSLDLALQNLTKDPAIYNDFKTIYRITGVPTKIQLSESLAQFVRSIRAGNSLFDQSKTNATVLNLAQAVGGILFFGKARCSTCHQGSNFTDESFHNIGSSDFNRQPQDFGRMVVTGNLYDIFKFKTPTLRDVERTAPYFHDGSKNSLEEVVDFYNLGGRNSTSDPFLFNLDREIRPLNLNEGEKRSLVEFLKALNSQSVFCGAQTSPCN